MLQVAQVLDATEAEGPGTRFAVWLQGCPLRCPGCCNPEMLPQSGGEPVSLSALSKRLDRAVSAEGVTLLGGEPFAQAAGCADFCEAVSARGLSVMIFSGFTIEALYARGDRDTRRLLEVCDLLVDGPYDRDLPDNQRRWIGSRNQRMHFLSSCYRRDDPAFVSQNTLEIRFQRGELVVNGWPALARSLRRP